MRRKGKQRSKYGAKKTVVDGLTFHSKKEADRYSQLKLLERAGQISRLELQPGFPIFINDTKCFTYKADFAYFTKDKRVIEDVKGMKTQIYRLKKKCVEAYYKVQIVEI